MATSGAHKKRSDVEADQLNRLNDLLKVVSTNNKFYKGQLNEAGLSLPLSSLEEFRKAVPFTTKANLVADQQAHPPYGTNLSYQREQYSRYSQTSATTGEPLRWLDTTESWQWMIDSWKEVFRAAEIDKDDTILFAFSFGPFIGFWLAFEAGAQVGALCLPGGGLNSLARLKMLMANRATVLCCTPTYALRLAEVAKAEGINLETSSVRKIVVAGEPGGSIPATRTRLETAWPGASVFDHHGMTEVGPVTYQCPESPRDLQVIESAYIAEVIDPENGVQITTGKQGELVLTTLGRHGSPLIRYRTGDLVEPDFIETAAGESMVLLGGILARIDDMITIRGVNIFPAGIESVIRSYAAVAEYEVHVDERKAMTEISIKIELTTGVASPRQVQDDISKELSTLYSMRIPVTLAQAGELPRYELKARRWKKIKA